MLYLQAFFVILNIASFFIATLSTMAIFALHYAIYLLLRAPWGVPGVQLAHTACPICAPKIDDSD